MKLKRLLQVMAFLLIASSIFGCTQAARDQNPGQVIVRVPWFTGEKYELVPKTLYTVENVSNLKGSAAHFIFAPRAVDGELRGMEASVRFIRAGGEYVPSDVLSLQLFSMYSYLEDLQQMALELGIPGFGKARTVAVKAEMRLPGMHVSELNNVRYWGRYDAILFAPFTGPALPLQASPGVIAHEFFHAIFREKVFSKLDPSFFESQALNDDGHLPEIMGLQAQKKPKSNDRSRAQYHLTLFRGINEGLADVWGWIYSGDPDFVRASIPHEERRNLRSAKEVTLTDLRQFPIEFLNQNTDEVVYSFGTRLAQRIFQSAAKVTTLSKSECRQELARVLVTALDDLKMRAAALADDEYMLPEEILAILQKQSKRIVIVEEKK